MRVLALDLGAKRIGMAICDALGISLRPLETFRRSGVERDIGRLRSLVERLEVEAVVVGLPLRMDGTAGDAAAAAVKFARRLGKALSVPVYMQDERLTSFEAEQIMSDSGMSRDERRRRSDEYAAMIILRDFLLTTSTKS